MNVSGRCLRLTHLGYGPEKMAYSLRSIVTVNRQRKEVRYVGVLINCDKRDAEETEIVAFNKLGSIY